MKRISMFLLPSRCLAPIGEEIGELERRIWFQEGKIKIKILKNLVLFYFILQELSQISKENDWLVS
jgi:hypothetical protein